MSEKQTKVEQLEKKLAFLEAAKKEPNEEELGILTNPELFKMITVDEFDKKIIGELETRQTIFLCACGAFVENNHIASYNLMVNSSSGAGKDYVASKVLQIFPKQNCVRRTRITPAVLNYWHCVRDEPEWTWNGKTLYLEDVSSDVLNHPATKLMASSGSFITIVEQSKAVDIEIKGKPVMIVTTASAYPSQELMRRFVICNLDETINQTKAVMKQKLAFAKHGLTNDYQNIITEALCCLKRKKVRIPYADKIEGYFPEGHIIMRTHLDRFLDYIKASCALHQYQRKEKEDFLIATGDDYDNARIAILKTTSNPLMIPLNKDQQKLLDIMKDMEKNKEVLINEETHTVSEIEGKVTFMSEQWLRKQLNKLAGFGFLEKGQLKKEGSDKMVTTYKTVDGLQLNIPTWEEIKGKEINQINKKTKKRNETNPAY